MDARIGQLVREGKTVNYINHPHQEGTVAELETILQQRAADRTALAAEYKITEQSLDLFARYASDGPNWSGQPMVGGNVGGSKEDRGNLTQLKRAKLISTSKSDGCDWIYFEARGLELAAKLGINTGN